MTLFFSNRQGYRDFYSYFRIVITLLLMFLLMRLMLVWRMQEVASQSDLTHILEAFITGSRFDLRIIAYLVLPLTFIGLIRGQWFRTTCLIWLSSLTVMCIVLGVMELEFYAEFQQRLNILVIQYLKEDPATVATMVWDGLPVIRYSLIALVMSVFMIWQFRVALSGTLPARANWPGKIVVVMVLLLITIVAARGTLRSGPPLRWGDAYTSDDVFTNQLGLNGIGTLAHALMNQRQTNKGQKWKQVVDAEQARKVTQSMLTSDTTRSLSDKKTRANIVIILLESFSAEFVGALGGPFNVTPEFDKLATKGMLFSHFFSNGTHTHQGTFATFSCFPNIPGHEYLMQQPEGQRKFSGLTRILPDYQSVYVYNGDFHWDNQSGFFKNQGMQKFVGRDDFVNPTFIDPVWGVSDQDMFSRGLQELSRLDSVNSGKPFIAYLQSLSNHLPYNLPEPLKFEPVTDAGGLSERLTAMKYSDWALGEFFRQASKTDYYDNTYFIILGDHGFGTANQISEINLLRFHIPMLIIGANIKPAINNTVASQVDIVPTAQGLLGTNQNRADKDSHCFGRDLLALPKSDPGFAMIKPSGSEPTAALLAGNHLLTFDFERGAHLYQYQLSPASARTIDNPVTRKKMLSQLQAYVRNAYDFLDQKRGTNH